MAIHKISADTAQEALRRARDEYGPDIMVVTNRRTTTGVEIVVATEDGLREMERQAVPLQGARESNRQMDPQKVVTSRRPASAELGAVRQVNWPVWDPDAQAEVKLWNRQDPTSSPEWQNNINAVADQLGHLRKMMENQLAGLAWGKIATGQPLRAQVLQGLMHAGFGWKLAQQIAEKAAGQPDWAKARHWIRAIIAHNIQAVPEEKENLRTGGIFALVGPTGVGKTTTVAKLAARAVSLSGAKNVAMIAADAYRIGALDQLNIYGELLGVPVLAAADTGDLRKALHALRGVKVVLIDTMGLNQRDKRVREQAVMLQQPNVRRFLTMNTATQLPTLEEAVSHYRAGGLQGCILTKADEAVMLGPVLDVVMRYRLPIHYMTTGQRVPEDIIIPEKKQLAALALQAFDASGDEPPSEETGVWMAAEQARQARAE